MIPRILLILIATLASASALTNENINQQLDVAPGGKLVVDVDFGTLDVAAGADNKVAVEAMRKIESNDEAKEKEYFATVPITITKDGNIVTVRARRNDNGNGHHWNWRQVNMDARYTIRVPKNFNADLHTSGGGIEASGLIGQIKVDTSGGKLKLRDLHGPVDGRTSGGSVNIEGCVGALKVVTSGGQISSIGGSGTLDARTSGGSVGVRDFGGDTTVETNGGKLTLANINGQLTGRTSGGSIFASLASPVIGDVKLETTAGTIEVDLPPGAGMDVKAEAGAVNIVNGLSFSGVSSGHDQLTGKINGGGKSLVLRSHAGNITLRQANGPTAQR